jgi:hypoxanthine phosphoribosyltransferase
MRLTNVENDIKVIYTAEQITERVHELGRIITSDYEGKDLACVGTVEDSFIFMADLVRAIQLPVACLFIKAITDEGADGSTRYKKIFYTSVTNLKGRHVLLVVGALDTGVTVDFLARNILLQQPSSLKIVALIDKPELRRSPAVAEYAAFTVHDQYVVGYGLGTEDKYRNFPSLAILPGHPTTAPDVVLALSRGAEE